MLRPLVIASLIGSLALTGQAASPLQGARVLHIALHDGFTGQTVSIAVDGRAVYRRDNVRTDLRISRADGFDVDVAGPTVTLSVTIEPGGQHASTQVDVGATPYVAVDLQDGGIHFKRSDEPFRYL